MTDAVPALQSPVKPEFAWDYRHGVVNTNTAINTFGRDGDILFVPTATVLGWLNEKEDLPEEFFSL